MIEITTTEGHYGRTSDVQFTVEGKNVYNRHHPHTVNFYTDGTRELSAGASIISAYATGPARTRITVRTGGQIKVDGMIYSILGNRMSDPSLVTDSQLIARARDHFVGGMIVEDVNVRKVREVGEQMPSDDPFLVIIEGVKVGTYGDYAGKLYRRSELAALFT